MNNNEKHSRTDESRPQNEGNGFNYTYSAKEQAELKRIRDKYIADTRSSETDKMAEIRRLDASVTQGASVFALCVGIIGALIMGFGMSLIMTNLKDFFSMNGTTAMIVGIIVGLVGMALVLVAYPLYQYISEKKRRKVAPEILRLTEELMNEGK